MKKRLSPRRFPPSLWALVLTALSLRGLALLATRSIPCVNDECAYRTLAMELAGGAGFQPHAGHYWPPGYIAFLAAHLHLGAGFLGAKLTQVVLSTLLVVLVYVLARQAGRSLGAGSAHRIGLIAALIVTLHPTLIAFSHYLWSETLFLVLFVGGLILLTDVVETRSSGRAVMAGLILGLSCLIKVLPLYLLPLLAAWLIFRTRRPRVEFLPAVLFLVSAFGVIMPWTVHNLATFHRLVLIETTTGKNLARGNNPVAPSNWDWGARRRNRGIMARTGCSQTDPIQLNTCLAGYGVKQILEHPGRSARWAVTKVTDLVNPTSFLVRHIRRGAYGEWPPWVADLIVILVAVFHMGLMGLAALGWLQAPRGPVRALTLLLVLYVFAVHIATFAMSRFRLPLEPLFAIGCAFFLSHPGSWIHQSRPRRLVGLLLVLLLATCWSRRLPWLFYEPSAEGSVVEPGFGD
ncbi:MAG: glycosyltransferase family 39 protein [Acidobacteriota bacterium]